MTKMEMISRRAFGFDRDAVRHQLRTCGVLAAARVAQAGREHRDLQVAKLKNRFEPKVARLEERIRKITSLEQTTTEKRILNVFLVVLVSSAVFLYLFFSFGSDFGMYH